MKIKATQLCRCGHKAAMHTINVFTYCDDNDLAPLDEVQRKSGASHVCSSNCIKFELNNLDLIEHLAEQRGLI